MYATFSSSQNILSNRNWPVMCGKSRAFNWYQFSVAQSSRLETTKYRNLQNKAFWQLVMITIYWKESKTCLRFDQTTPGVPCWRKTITKPLTSPMHPALIALKSLLFGQITFTAKE